MNRLLIKDFLDMPRSLQKSIFEEMECTINMILESYDGAIIFYQDENGISRKCIEYRDSKELMDE